MASSTRPYSIIGMPYYKETLLSAWSGDQVFEVGRPVIDVEAGLNVEHSKWGPIAKNPGKTLRNQLQAKTKLEANGKSKSQYGQLDTNFMGPYANVRIKYGSHGISGFDFQ